MKADKKKERLAALFGIEAPVQVSPVDQLEADNTSREMEAVLAYYDTPRGFIERRCLFCERLFAVNRANIGYCSDDCRKKALAERGLIIANYPARTPAERWATQTGGPEPLTVPPEALQLIQAVRPQSELETPTVIPDQSDLTVDIDALLTSLGE
jgi:hypothetical protein